MFSIEKKHGVVAGALVRARSKDNPCVQRSAMIPLICTGICRGKRRPAANRRDPSSIAATATCVP
jgi:hypothetical protein